MDELKPSDVRVISRRAMRYAPYPRAVLNAVLHARISNAKLDTADNKKAQPKLDL